MLFQRKVLGSCLNPGYDSTSKVLKGSTVPATSSGNFFLFMGLVPVFLWDLGQFSDYGTWARFLWDLGMQPCFNHVYILLRDAKFLHCFPQVSMLYSVKGL